MDWEPRVLRQSEPKEASSITPHRTVRGFGLTGARAVRLDDNESLDFKHKTIPLYFKTALMKARQEKKWTQKELAQKINAKPSVIQDYESGKTIPIPGIIQKLNRALGVKLPRINKPKPVV